MKIERKEKQFEPVVITIETREELEHLLSALHSDSKENWNILKKEVPELHLGKYDSELNFDMYEMFHNYVLDEVNA